MKKSELRTMIREEATRLSEVNAGDYIKALHYATNQAERDKVHKMIRQSGGWSKDDTLYMLKKYRKDINYTGPEFHVDVKMDVPAKTAAWTEALYKRWINSVASNGGSHHAYDMAQNAKYQPGLIDYVRRQIQRYGGDEKPLERIQWDIEAKA